MLKGLRFQPGLPSPLRVTLVTSPVLYSPEPPGKLSHPLLLKNSVISRVSVEELAET